MLLSVTGDMYLLWQLCTDQCGSSVYEQMCRLCPVPLKLGLGICLVTLLRYIVLCGRLSSVVLALSGTVNPGSVCATADVYTYFPITLWWACCVCVCSMAEVPCTWLLTKATLKLCGSCWKLAAAWTSRMMWVHPLFTHTAHAFLSSFTLSCNGWFSCFFFYFQILLSWIYHFGSKLSLSRK